LTSRQKQLRSYLCEAEVVEGLEQIAADELRRFVGGRVQLQDAPRERDGFVRFRYSGDLWRLQALRTVQAVYLVEYFAVSRPRALLGDQNFRIVIGQLNTVRQGTIKTFFQSLELSAAGEDSPVMKRLKEELSKGLGLEQAQDKGDLLIRVIPARDKEGWETLVRLTPRPLATRSWRVCNFEGALNASVASAMIAMSQPTPNDIFINLGSGSGTLLIERAQWGRAGYILGIENDPQAQACAEQNIRASHRSGQIARVWGDMTCTPFPDASVTTICADLPFGQRVGSHQDNLSLYPNVLKEAARITSRGGQFIFISHEVKLTERLLKNNPAWSLQRELRVTLRGLHPRIYHLIRR
jgi:tRNA (guanine6-N2)-methyltransferase